MAAIALAVGLWIWALSSPSPVLVTVSNALSLGLAILGVLGAFLVAVRLWLGSASFWGRGLALLLVSALIASGFWIRRYTDLGLLMLGGASFWVEKASTAPDPEARVFLQVVLDSTQYGVDQAERAVTVLPTKVQRERLFLLLSELAPNERWQRRYRKRLDRERARSATND